MWLAQAFPRTLTIRIHGSYPGFRAPNASTRSRSSHRTMTFWLKRPLRGHGWRILTASLDLTDRSSIPPVSLPMSFRHAGRVCGNCTDLSVGRWWAIRSSGPAREKQRSLIYPDHLKYDQVTRLPYSALFERLRQFLTTPDTLFICSGFSFLDRHICAVLDEALAANAHTAILAFQYCLLEEETAATQLASSRPNMSVYARDAAIIHGIAGRWQPGHSPNEEWKEIRRTFWRDASHDQPAEFLLGDFARLAQFLALTRSEQIAPSSREDEEAGNGSERGESSDA